MPDWLKVTLLLAGIVAVIAIAIYAVERSEIAAHQYVRVGDMPPEMQPEIEQAMTDGYISVWEFDRLNASRNRLAVKRRLERP